MNYTYDRVNAGRGHGEFTAVSARMKAIDQEANAKLREHRIQVEQRRAAQREVAARKEMEQQITKADAWFRQHQLGMGDPKKPEGVYASIRIEQRLAQERAEAMTRYQSSIQ